MVRNNEEKQGIAVAATQQERLWFPMTLSAKTPADFTTESNTSTAVINPLEISSPFASQVCMFTDAGHRPPEFFLPLSNTPALTGAREPHW